MTIQTLPSSVKASTWLVGVSISGSRCLIRRGPGGAESGHDHCAQRNNCMERPRGRGERAGPVRTGAGITGKVEGAANSTGEPQPRRTPRPPHPPGQGQDQPAPPRPNPQALRPTSARASGSRGAGPPESHGHPQPRRRRTYAGTLTRSTPDPLGPRRRRAIRRRG